LKLRMFANGHGELIAYERPDSTGPKTSNYFITPTQDPEGLRDSLDPLARPDRPGAQAPHALSRRRDAHSPR
jgi:hypothetical protein